MIAHQLAKMKMAGQTLLREVSYMKTFLVNERLKLDLKIPKTKLKAMCAKFPEVSQIIKASGAKSSTVEAEIERFLSPLYATLVGIAEFSELTLSTLRSCVQENINFLSVDLNPDLMELICDLLYIYIRLVHLSQRKLCKIVYCVYVYALSTMNKDMAAENLVHPRLLAFLRQYQDPVKSLLKELNGFSEPLGEGLARFMPTFLSIRDVNLVSAHFSSALGGVEITQPPSDTTYYHMMKIENIRSWYTVLMFYFPDRLLTKERIEQLKEVISDTTFVPMLQDKMYILSKLYEELLVYKVKGVQMGKLKKCIKESAIDSVRCAEMHRKQRLLWNHELLVWHALLSDTPALAGPKLPVILGLLANAREEIFWYFRYQANFAKLKVGQPMADDTTVSEMIYYSTCIQRILVQQKECVVRYCVDYLRGADTGYLKGLVQDAELVSMLGEDSRVVFSWVIQWTSIAEPNWDFAKVEQKWAEIQVYFTLLDRNSQERLDYLAKVVNRLQHILFHIRVVNSLESLISEYTSLRELWYFEPHVYEFYERLALGNSEDFYKSHLVSSYLVLLSQAVENAPPSNRAIAKEFRDSSRQLALKFIKNVCSRIIQLLEYIFIFKCYYEDQTVPSMMTESMSHALKKGSKSSASAAQHPGWECQWHNQVQLSDAEDAINLLWPLCREFEEFKGIVIGNVLIYPKAYLAEKIRKAMKKRIVEQAWLQGQERPNYSGFSKDDLILRQPSALYHRVFLLIQEYQYFDYFVNLNMPALVKNVIQSYLAPSSQFQNRKAQGSTLTDAVTSWYANSFFKQRCTSPIVSARYLSMRRVFFTTPHYTFKVERYIESNELNALVRLLGPCGIRHLDCAMLDCTVQQIRVLLDAFKLMKPQLKTINNSELYSTHVQVLKTLKSSTYIREFIISAISLGRILTYRRMIYDALEDVQHQVVPHIYQSLKNTCQQALQMSGSNADISELRSLAQDAGVRIMGDQVLTDAISAAIKTDKERYSLLPLAFVVSLFSSSEWRDANFDPVTQSFDNNIHLVARAIIDTFWFFSSIQKTGRQEYFENQFIFFVGKSTTMLAYLIADQKLEKAVPKEFINILIFLDLFVKLIPLSFRRRVKWHLPYALIRLARTTSKKKKTS